MAKVKNGHGEAKVLFDPLIKPTPNDDFGLSGHKTLSPHREIIIKNALCLEMKKHADSFISGLEFQAQPTKVGLEMEK